ncbi:hypothetical protein HY480_01425 [Candidatus Uhrbacteria bacterium]|nr:hypothetical protein [Candidatus Uhrbacteria bacterium]
MDRMMQFASVFVVAFALFAVPVLHFTDATPSADAVADIFVEAAPTGTVTLGEVTIVRRSPAEVALARTEASETIDALADLFDGEDDDEGDEMPAVAVDFGDEPMVIVASAATTPSCSTHACALR